MLKQYFDYPKVENLKRLVSQSLTQKVILLKAVRLWVILRSIYNEHEFEVTDFTYSEWRDFFFKDAETYHNRPKNKTKNYNLEHKDPECPCNKLIKDLVFTSDIDQNWEKWKREFIDSYQGLFSKEELEKYLKQFSEEDIFPFRCNSKTIEYNFGHLQEIGWLLPSNQADKKYAKKQEQELPSLDLNQNSSEIAQTYNLFTDDDYSILIEKFSLSQSINGIQRLFFHADYKIPSESRKRVDQCRDQLNNIWAEKPVPIIQIRYKSSSCDGKESDYIIYPVCLYYYQRSFYLCAFGQYPHATIKEDENSWYNYRLDRILSIQKLELNQDSIPSEIIDKAWEEQEEEEQEEIQADDTYNGPLVEEIQEELDSVYGFDFYLEQDTMLLRFPSKFNKNYVRNTVRHRTFKQVSYQEAINHVENDASLSNQKREQLKAQIKNHPDDGYYTLKYRKNENSVIMRLRAWCPNVEVLLPWDLRQRMKEDMQKTWKLYENDPE